MDFVQVRLDDEAISNNIAAFVRAGKVSLNISPYYLTLSKVKQRLWAERNLNTTPAAKPYRCKPHYITYSKIRFIFFCYWLTFILLDKIKKTKE